MEPDKVMHLARDLGFLRVKDLLERELHPETLRRLCRRGLLERMGRGLYRLAGDLPVKAVAAETGFGDVFHFSRLFRKRCGTSPSAYRTQVRRGRM